MKVIDLTVNSLLLSRFIIIFTLEDLNLMKQIITCDLNKL